jgi:hypothetical protein
MKHLSNKGSYFSRTTDAFSKRNSIPFKAAILTASNLSKHDFKKKLVRISPCFDKADYISK